MDILTSISNDGAELYWLENDGIGNFTENWLPDHSNNLTNKFRNPVIAAMNRDGYPDIVANN